MASASQNTNFIIGIQDLDVVFNDTIDVSPNWETMLLNLELNKDGTIRRIRDRQNDRSVKDCYYEGLSEWLNKGERSWIDIVNALITPSMRENDVASRIIVKYNIPRSLLTIWSPEPESQQPERPEQQPQPEFPQPERPQPKSPQPNPERNCREWTRKQWFRLASLSVIFCIMIIVIMVLATVLPLTQTSTQPGTIRLNVTSLIQLPMESTIIVGEPVVRLEQDEVLILDVSSLCLSPLISVDFIVNDCRDMLTLTRNTPVNIRITKSLIAQPTIAINVQYLLAGSFLTFSIILEYNPGGCLAKLVIFTERSQYQVFLETGNTFGAEVNMCLNKSQIIVDQYIMQSSYYFTGLALQSNTIHHVTVQITGTRREYIKTVILNSLFSSLHFDIFKCPPNCVRSITNVPENTRFCVYASVPGTMRNNVFESCLIPGFGVQTATKPNSFFLLTLMVVSLYVASTVN